MISQNRAKRCIFCDRKGTLRKSLLQKGFLTQNRAQKGKRAIRAHLELGINVKDCAEGANIFCSNVSTVELGLSRKKKF